MHLDETLSWPFFDDGHRRFAESLSRWADATLGALPHDDVDAACRARVKAAAHGNMTGAGFTTRYPSMKDRDCVSIVSVATSLTTARSSTQSRAGGWERLSPATDGT